MAGPTISVLLRFEPDQSTEELVQAYLAQRADHLRPGSRTFSVGGCALLYEGEALFSAGDFERWLQHADFRLVK
ncbi:hypothetical protein [Pseudomonas protegens]|uniref:hypothetical protein n=1 Tax=Pseudomonas protegens TaxID=380021 RepID=UPI0039067154